MKISKETLEVLKNFSAINPNLVIKPGNKLSTIAEAKNVMASAEVVETFPKEFGIYDLNEFLSVLSLTTDPELEFTDDEVVIVDGNKTVKYRYADTSILTSPQKEVNMPDTDLTVSLTQEVISNIRRAGSALNHVVVSLQADGTDVTIAVKDPANASANTYIESVGQSDHTDYDFQFLISNLKLIPGDYEVSVSSKLISHWKCINNNSVEYWIALEKNSTFNN
jgi:hypothetical protein